MKVKPMKVLDSMPIKTERKKISHVDVFPDDYKKIPTKSTIASFYDLVRTTIKRYKDNLHTISSADRKIQDLLHEIELLPAANVVQGYRFYDQIRELRRLRRMAKLENETLKPIYDYLENFPDVIGEMRKLTDACASAEFHASNYEYVYKVQE